MNCLSQHKELITNPGDTDRMMQMITGYWVTQVVHAAATYCN